MAYPPHHLRNQDGGLQDRRTSTRVAHTSLYTISMLDVWNVKKYVAFWCMYNNDLQDDFLLCKFGVLYFGQFMDVAKMAAWKARTYHMGVKWRESGPGEWVASLHASHMHAHLDHLAKCSPSLSLLHFAYKTPKCKFLTDLCEPHYHSRMLTRKCIIIRISFYITTISKWCFISSVKVLSVCIAIVFFTSSSVISQGQM